MVVENIYQYFEKWKKVIIGNKFDSIYFNGKKFKNNTNNAFQFPNTIPNNAFQFPNTIHNNQFQFPNTIPNNVFQFLNTIPNTAIQFPNTIPNNAFQVNRDLRQQHSAAELTAVQVNSTPLQD